MMMMMCVTPGAVVYLYGCTSETEMRDVGLLDARRHSVGTHVLRILSMHLMRLFS